jgi:hypothetical protein
MRAITVLLWILTLGSFGHAATSLERAGLSDFAFVTGQVIAISEPTFDPSTFFFEASSGSRLGHVGVVVVKNKKVLVYEADPTLGGTGSESIETFIARSEDGAGQFGYLILQPVLTAIQQKKLISVVDQYAKAKVPYNFKQVYKGDDKTLNCSEFVFTVFGKIGVENIGTIETVQNAINLNTMNGGVVQLAQMFGGGTIPNPEDNIITPLSVVKSVGLTPLIGTLPYANILSDAEVFSAWKSFDGYLAMVTSPTGRGMKKDPIAYLKEVQADPAQKAAYEPTVQMIESTLTSGGPLKQEPFRQFPEGWRKD